MEDTLNNVPVLRSHFAILIIVTNFGTYNSRKDIGLWLSELTHVYHDANASGYKITIASPSGGDVPVDPESLKPITLDKISKVYRNSLDFRQLLTQSKRLLDIAGEEFEMVYLEKQKSK